MYAKLVGGPLYYDFVVVIIIMVYLLVLRSSKVCPPPLFCDPTLLVVCIMVPLVINHPLLTPRGTDS